MKNIDLSFALGLPPEDAIKYFQSKGYKFSYDWHETKNGAHSKAFTVAKAMKLDILSDIRESVDNSISKGMTFEEFRRELEPKLRSKGIPCRRMSASCGGRRRRSSSSSLQRPKSRM